MTSMTKHVESNAAMTAMVPFVGQYNRNMENLIGSYLGMDVVRLTEENSPVATNVALTTLATRYKEDAECRREGFDEQMITVFRENGLSLWRLPVFDLNAFKHEPEVIMPNDLFKQDQDVVISGLFRIQRASWTSGFGFYIQKKDSQHISDKIPQFSAFLMTVRRRNNTVLHQNRGPYRMAMEMAYHNHHKPEHKGHIIDECDTCQYINTPTLPMQIRLLKSLVEKTDPLFELAAPILQVDNPILPALEAPKEEEKPQAQPVQAQPAQAQASNSWLGSLGSFFRRNLGLKE